MDSRHAIDQAVFDINFDSADAAAAQQHELAGFIRDRLLPLAEEIFGELSERGSLSKIDRLEIDLGDIRYDGYREEMTVRFRERLRAELQGKLREIGAAPSALEYTVDRASAEGGLLQHFLETGNLARGVRGGAEEFERMLLRSLSSSGSDFAAYLRRAPDRSTVVGRMARQFPPAALSAVLRLLAPEHSARLERLVEQYLQQQLRERPQAAASELMPRIWEALLHELLRGDGRSADAERLFEDGMRQMFAGQEAAGPAAAGLLATHLEAALYGGSAGRLAQLWGEALRASPETLRGVFAARLGEARARHALAAALPHGQLLELAALAAPQHGATVAALFDLPAAQAMLAHDGKAGLWAYVLGTLHGGEAPGRESFEHALRFAAQAGGSAGEAAAVEGGSGRAVETAAARHGAERDESASGDARIARLLQSLRDNPAGLASLDTAELARLVRAVARRNGAPPGGDFERGIEHHARRAADAQAYHREVLRQLLDGGAVDLERAEQAGGAAPMSGEALLRARLEAALVQGRAEALDGAWEASLRDHPALVREIFARHMGEAHCRRKLASGFPQPMLRQLLELMVPRQSAQVLGLLDEVARIAAGRGQDTALQAACWEYTLERLHAAAQGELEIDEYARGLVRRLAALDAALPDAGEAAVAGAAHRLLQRLQGGVLQEGASGDIGELCEAEPAALGELLRRLRAGEIRPGLPALDAEELRQLAAALVRLKSGEAGAGFVGEIGKYARQARDARRYYLHVAECLLHERIVDLEQALAEAGNREAGAASERDMAGSLRHWLGQLLARAETGAAGLSPERAGYVREAFLRIMGDAAAGRELLSGRYETRMPELVAELQPAVARIATLLCGSAAGKAVRGFWASTLEYLHAVGCDGFDARDYLGRVLAFDGDPAHGDGAVAAGRLAPDQVRALLDACAEETVHDDAEPDPHARLYRLLRGSGRRDGQHAAASSAAAAREAALRARFASALEAGAAQEVASLWDALRSQHAEMARAVLLECAAKAQVRARIAAGLPEAMRVELLELAAPGMGKLAGALADDLRRQGGGEEAVATLWRHALDGLATEVQGFSPQRYERGLSRRLAATVRELPKARADAGGGQDYAGPGRDRVQAERAAQLQRQVARRLAGDLGEEVTAQIAELAAAHPEAVRELLRQLRVGELRLDAARLTQREAEQLVASFAELEPDGAGLVQQQRGRQDAMASLERLIGSHRSGPAAARADAVARPGAATVEAMLEAALAARDAQALDGLWQRNRQHAEALCGFFRKALADAQNRAWLAGWLPQDMLVELAALLQPRESQFIAALSGLPGFAPAQRAAGTRAAWCELTLEFLGAAESASWRAAYARAMVRRLAAPGLEEEALWREIVRADEVLGTTHEQAGQETAQGSPRQTRARQPGTAERQAGTVERPQGVVHAGDGVRPERELRHALQDGATAGVAEAVAGQTVPPRARTGAGRYDGIVRRLRGEAGAARIDAVLGEFEAGEPQAYAGLLGRLQSGEFAAAFDRLEAGELERLVDAVARHNGAPPGGDFARSIERHAQLAADLAGYYREVLRQLLAGAAVDLELAASGPQRRSTQVMTSGQPITNGQAMTDGQDVSTAPAISGEHAMSGEQAASAQPTAFEFGDGKRPGKVEQELYIANAGLVLVAPYLPHLFGRLGLTTAAGFSDAAAAERAVHLTQFVVNESCDSPEFLLPLNRILCGVPESQPIVREIRIAEQERNTVEEMLKAVIAAWKVVGNTSVAGLRESFLQRAGRLSLMEDGWHLEVEKRTLDVLLDQLPWSFAVVKYSWMPQPLYVEWR